mgnify:CR=1 FL=1
MKLLASAALSLSVVVTMTPLTAIPAFATSKGVTSITRVSPASSKVTMQAGQSKTFKYKLAPSKGLSSSAKKVTWKSSKTSVASVASTGIVKAKAAGTSRITVKAKSGKSASWTVTVKKTASKTTAPAVSERTVYVTPQWVKSVIDGNQAESKNYVILETSTTETPYNSGHIPGSYHSDVHQFETSTYAAYANNTIDYSDENLGNLVSDEQLAKVLAKYGITRDTTVILYGAHPATEREAFAMLYCGVKNVKVLNGDINNWKKAGYSVETKENTPKENSNFGAKIPGRPELIMSKEGVKKNLAENKNFKLVSIRSLDEFEGLSDGNYPMLQVKGEIAGAVFGHAGSNADTMEEYMNSDGTVISYNTFVKFMAESNVKPTNEVCFYCGTGWRATMPLLLAYEHGWNVSLYDGGWWQWSRDLEHNATQMLRPDQAKTCSSFNYTTTSVNLKKGDTYTNNDIHIFPASGTLPTVRFKSNNNNVATVDSTGKVTAVGAGSCTIQMIATDQSARNTSYTVTVE